MYSLLCRIVRIILRRNSRKRTVNPPSDWRLPDDYLEIERKQVRHHREAAGLDPDIPPTAVPGLAIAGGGIRSAVFSLGVLQALAEQESLKHFSYMSTVSGGTYLGAFYGSLFIPDTLRHGATLTPERTFIACAQSAPDRLKPKTPPSNAGAVTPIEYLRDNCNYLIPNGFNDVLQSAVFSMRNWFALQYVIGVSILTIVLWVNLAELVPWWCDRSAGDCQPDQGWLVPAFMAGVIAVAGLSPLSRAYWLTQNLAQDMRRSFHALPWISLFLVDVAAFGTMFVLDKPVWPPFHNWNLSSSYRVITVAWLVIGTQLFAIAYYLRAWCYTKSHADSRRQRVPGAARPAVRASNSRPFVDRLRNALTNAYTSPLQIGRWKFFAGPAQMLIYLMLIALVDAMGAAIHHGMIDYCQGWDHGEPPCSESTLLGKLAAAGAAVWAAGKFLLSNVDKIESAVVRIPRIVLASVAAIVAALLTLAFWSTVAHYVVAGLARYGYNGDNLDRLAWPALLTFTPSLQWRGEFALACACLLALLLAMVDGLCIQFLNLSTYQRLYSTRLTRTFLGASNKIRLDNADQRDVTSLVTGDSVSTGQYYHEESRAPVHLINATINKTIDWNSSLVHRGARGLSISLGPAGITVGAKLGVLKCKWESADDISTKATHIMGAHPTPNIWLESMTLGD